MVFWFVVASPSKQRLGVDVRQLGAGLFGVVVEGQAQPPPRSAQRPRGARGLALCRPGRRHHAPPGVVRSCPIAE